MQLHFRYSFIELVKSQDLFHVRFFSIFVSEIFVRKHNYL